MRRDVCREDESLDLGLRFLRVLRRVEPAKRQQELQRCPQQTRTGSLAPTARRAL